MGADPNDIHIGGIHQLLPTPDNSGIQPFVRDEFSGAGRSRVGDRNDLDAFNFAKPRKMPLPHDRSGSDYPDS